MTGAAPRDHRATGYVQRCDGCPATDLHYVHDGVRYHLIRYSEETPMPTPQTPTVDETARALHEARQDAMHRLYPDSDRETYDHLTPSQRSLLTLTAEALVDDFLRPLLEDRR